MVSIGVFAKVEVSIIAKSPVYGSELSKEWSDEVFSQTGARHSSSSVLVHSCDHTIDGFFFVSWRLEVRVALCLFQVTLLPHSQ